MLTLNLLNFLFWIFFIIFIPNPNHARQEIPPQMQDEHGDAIEENEWVHEGLRRCCKVNACTGSYATKWCFVGTWTKYMTFKCN
jgi:hypothetical protein